MFYLILPFFFKENSPIRKKQFLHYNGFIDVFLDSSLTKKGLRWD